MAKTEKRDLEQDDKIEKNEKKYCKKVTIHSQNQNSVQQNNKKRFLILSPLLCMIMIQGHVHKIVVLRTLRSSDFSFIFYFSLKFCDNTFFMMIYYYEILIAIKKIN